MADRATVVSQTEASGQYPDGSYGEGMKVTAQTAGGTRFSVFVPTPLYTADKVRDMLAARLAEVEAAEGLTL